MSKATKRKHVTREVLEGDVKLSDGQSIVRVSLWITVVQCKQNCIVLTILLNVNSTVLLIFQGTVTYIPAVVY